MPPLFSVVVPVYRAGPALRDCLDSLLAQSFEDFEIIAVNDASPDDAGEVLAGYAAGEPRLRVHENETNRNLYDSRLLGFRLASAPYVTTCDADDAMPPGALAAFAAAVKRGNPDMVHGRARELGGVRDGRVLHNCERFPVGTGRDFVRSLLANGRGWNIWGKLFRTEALRRGLARLPRGKDWFMLEDLLFCVAFGCACGTYAGIADTVYRYRYPTGTPPAGQALTRSFGQLEIMGFLRRNAAELGVDAESVAAMSTLFALLVRYDARRYGREELPGLVEKGCRELGDAFPLREVEARSSGKAWLRPGYHLGFLARHGAREYALKLLTLTAAARRKGWLGTVGEVLCEIRGCADDKS